MNNEQRDFLQLPRIPAVISLQECAWLTGFSEEEVSILIAARILSPLSNPRLNEKRTFASVAVEKFARDLSELTRARTAIRAYWQKKNRSRRNSLSRNGSSSVLAH
jgi:hypothetical protein